jgi:hypothetical protein
VKFKQCVAVIKSAADLQTCRDARNRALTVPDALDYTKALGKKEISHAREASDPIAEYSALQGKPIVGRCHMDVCWWFSIENAEMMGQSKDGELFAVTMKQWSASCPGLKCGRKSFDGGGTSFVFCSRTHPTWIDRSEEYKDDPNKWTFTPLGPGSPDAASGVHEGVHRMYWADVTT